MFRSGGFSPTIYDRKVSFQNKNIAFSNAQRFMEKDSLYLDMGKPEITGRVDTITNGSMNNSLLIFRADSFNGASPKSSSPLSRFLTQSSSFKIHASGGNGNQTFRKREEGKEDNLIRSKLQEVKQDRRHSEYLTTKMTEGPKNLTLGDYSTDEEMQEVSQENPQMQKNIEKLKYGTQPKHPSKFTHSVSAKMFEFINLDPKKREKDSKFLCLDCK